MPLIGLQEKNKSKFTYGEVTGGKTMRIHTDKPESSSSGEEVVQDEEHEHDEELSETGDDKKKRGHKKKKKKKKTKADTIPASQIGPLEIDVEEIVDGKPVVRKVTLLLESDDEDGHPSRPPSTDPNQPVCVPPILKLKVSTASPLRAYMEQCIRKLALSLANENIDPSFASSILTSGSMAMSHLDTDALTKADQDSSGKKGKRGSVSPSSANIVPQLDFDNLFNRHSGAIPDAFTGTLTPDSARRKLSSILSADEEAPHPKRRGSAKALVRTASSSRSRLIETKHSESFSEKSSHTLFGTPIDSDHEDLEKGPSTANLEIFDPNALAEPFPHVIPGLKGQRPSKIFAPGGQLPDIKLGQSDNEGGGRRISKTYSLHARPKGDMDKVLDRALIPKKFHGSGHASPPKDDPGAGAESGGKSIKNRRFSVATDDLVLEGLRAPSVAGKQNSMSYDMFGFCWNIVL